MDVFATGFWGAFFGAAALALIGALVAFREARRVAQAGALAVVLAAAYAVVFLGWVPTRDAELLQRVQALTAIASAAVLAVLLFLLLDTFHGREALARARASVLFLAIAAGVATLFTPAHAALEIGIGAAVIVAVATMAASATSARHGDRAGGLTLAALMFLSIGMLGVDWYALHPERTHGWLHAASAMCGIAFLACIAAAMASRYAYLIEVSQALRHGPHFDPVTRMPAYEAGQHAAAVFPGFEGRPCALIAVTIANLKLLEELHGRAAYNHALFVCASRLRRLSLPGVEYGHLREDGFVILFHHPPETDDLIEHARQVMLRLSRRVTLATGRDIAALEAGGRGWEAQVGVGVTIESESVQLELAIAGARAMSRSALGYPSGIAWYDEASESFSEVPSQD